MPVDVKFELTAQEKDSALWKKLRGHMLNRVKIAHQRNEGALDIDETNRLRGKIAAFKELLGLDTSAINTTDREAGGVE